MEAGRHFSVSDRREHGNPGGKLQCSGDWNGTHFTHWIWGPWPSEGLWLQRQREREREWCMLSFFQSSFLPFSTGLSDILFLLLHPSPWLRRSQIPVSHLTTATWVSVQIYNFKQGTEVSLRPPALVYIMQMGTGEGQTVTAFFVETENYSVALSRTLEASPYCYLESY